MGAKVAILGAGAWGTAIAKVIAEKSNDVILWCRRQEQADEINTKHTNSHYLKEVRLPAALRATSDVQTAVQDREYIILAVPSLYIMNTVKQILGAPSIREGECAIAVITKGFLPSPNGPRTIVETLEDYLPGFYNGSVVYISGPSHAEEVARDKITGLISASRNARNSIRFRYLLKGERLMVFSSLDVQGVQVAAAVKNIIAVAFGVLDALKNKFSGSGTEEIIGDNTGSLLLAAGLNEIQTLGKAMGATHSETFTSIAGVGDLDVTCRSIYGRNRRLGREIVEKQILKNFKNIDDLINRIGELGYMPEGIAAAKQVKVLQGKLKLKLPICTFVYRILNKEIKGEQAVHKYLKEIS
ncbi:glycerol-3-phosphate dehydrogenase [NAD(P)+] [Spirochaetia bacterium]|nr:glycerol-3-phosphate dehydrogenase [NAD(P)+] [Spirochaetia bacterium]